ncbi:MAG: vWA domain-containing protein [Clostridiaceae bacterium]|nr:VWA domain-containing protein [Eubacteriales bacterium]
MKTKKGMRLASALLAVLLAVCVLPASSLAAWPEYLKITEKTGFDTASSTVPSSMDNGEVWVDRVAKSEGNSPAATIEISALGRQFAVTEQVLRKYNIIFVLDMSNSMAGVKCANMAKAANDAVKALVPAGNTLNKVGLVTFGKTAKLNRSLMTTGFTLSEEQYPDGGKISVFPSSNNDIGGGTNIQAGLNVAFNALKAGTNAGEIPVIILLSDGAPTYYYDSVALNSYGNAPTGSGTSGNGSTTTGNEISMTILQAAYLKAMLSGLRIYTISFDINSAGSENAKKALATLNATSENITSVTEKTRVNYTDYTLAELINYYKPIKVTNTNVRNSMKIDYTDGWYSADISTSSLSAALTNIINQIKKSNPIEESVAGPTDPSLAETSYLKITDSIGEGFDLSATATVRYQGHDYTFTRSGANYTYTGDNADMSRIVLTYADHELVWKIPGSVLPCVSVDGTIKPDPVRLLYTVTLNDASLEPKLYETSSDCVAWFRPASDNPNYPYAFVDSIAEKKDIPMTNTTYNGAQKAVFIGSGMDTKIMYFGTITTPGEAAYTTGDISKISNASYDGSELRLTYTSSGKAKAYVFTTVTGVSATVSLSTKNKNSSPDSKSSYNSATVMLGGVSFSATVDNVVKVGSNYNITLKFTINGQDRTYLLENVAMSRPDSNSKYTGTGTMNYFVTEFSDVQRDNYVTYTAATQTLVLRNAPANGSTSTLGTVTLVAGVVGNVTTTIEQLDDDTFIATKIAENGDGTFVKTVYTVSNGKLDVKTTTRTLSTTLRAEQTKRINSGGTMLVGSDLIVTDVKLTALDGKSVTVLATPITVSGGRDYEAKVLLTFNVRAKFSNLTFALETVNGGKAAALSGYTVTGTSQGLIQNADGTFRADAAGPCWVIVKFTNPYKSPVPASFFVRFSSLSYKISATVAQVVEHDDGYAGQQVKVVMNSPTKH